MASLLSRFIDNTVSTMFGYDAVNRTNERRSSGGLFKNSSPSSYRMERDRIKLMWDARDMERNYPIVGGILDRETDYVLHKVSFQAMTSDREVNTVYQDYFKAWCEETTAGKTACDITGRHPFLKLAQLAYRGQRRDGDHGVLFCEEDGDLRLQMIESDRIGNPMVLQSADEANVSGVLIDLEKGGDVTGYDLYRRTRTAMYVQEENGPYPVSRFCHLFDPDRVDAYRCPTWFDTTLHIIRDLGETMHNDDMGIKFASSFAGFVKTSTPYGDPSSEFGEVDPNTGMKTWKSEAGMVRKLPDGTDIVFPPSPNRPSGSFLNYVEVRLREIALGLNRPYGFIWNMATLGGVTARIENMMLDRCYESERGAIEHQLLNRVKNAVLARGIEKGAIPAHPEWKKGTWNYGAKIVTDAGYEAQNNQIAVQNGWKTNTQVIADYGNGDFQSITNVQADEVLTKQEVSMGKNVPIELLDASKPNATALLAAMQQRQDPNGGQPPGAAPQEPAAPPAPAGLLASHDPKAIKPLLDLLKQLNSGLVTPEQAVSTLVALYGVSPEEASAVVMGK
jgi:capsid protein